MTRKYLPCADRESSRRDAYQTQLQKLAQKLATDYVSQTTQEARPIVQLTLRAQRQGVMLLQTREEVLDRELYDPSPHWEETVSNVFLSRSRLPRFRRPLLPRMAKATESVADRDRDSIQPRCGSTIEILLISLADERSRRKSAVTIDQTRPPVATRSALASQIKLRPLTLPADLCEQTSQRSTPRSHFRLLLPT